MAPGLGPQPTIKESFYNKLDEERNLGEEDWGKRFDKWAKEKWQKFDVEKDIGDPIRKKFQQYGPKVGWEKAKTITPYGEMSPEEQKAAKSAGETGLAVGGLVAGIPLVGRGIRAISKIPKGAKTPKGPEIVSPEKVPSGLKDVTPAPKVEPPKALPAPKETPMAFKPEAPSPKIGRAHV